MPTNRLAIFGGGLLIAAILGGFTHGIAPVTYEGATWNEALAKVPCKDVAKDGKNLKITGIIVVDGKQFPNPTISKEDQVEPLDKRCFPKH
jgi:hypothetical protein